MRTVLVAPESESGEMFMTANWGVTSIGFQTVPLSCSPNDGWLLSVEATVTVLKTAPLKLALLNCTGMVPVWPGSTLCVQSPAVVQPQEGCTWVTSSTSVPMLVNT